MDIYNEYSGIIFEGLRQILYNLNGTQYKIMKNFIFNLFLLNDFLGKQYSWCNLCLVWQFNPKDS